MNVSHTPPDLEPTRTTRISTHTAVVDNQEADFLIKDLTGLPSSPYMDFSWNPEASFTPSPTTLTIRNALRHVIGDGTLHLSTDNAIEIQALRLNIPSDALYHTLSVTKLEPLSTFFDLPAIYSITVTPLALPFRFGVHYTDNLTPYAQILNPRWVFSFDFIPFGYITLPLHTLLAMDTYITGEHKDEPLNEWKPEHLSPASHIHSHISPPEIYPDHTTRPPIDGVEWTNHTDSRFFAPTPPGVDFFTDASRATSPVLSTALLLNSDILITTKADDLLHYRTPSPWSF